jgi:hypothetical protein
VNLIDPTSMVPSLQDARAEVFDDMSRYRGLPILVYVDAGGVEHAYVDRRFVPQPDRMAAIGQIDVRDGDRIDNIAAEQLGEPRWWWRLADANRVLAPSALTERIGRKLLVTLPPGVPLPRRAQG